MIQLVLGDADAILERQVLGQLHQHVAIAIPGGEVGGGGAGQLGRTIGELAKHLAQVEARRERAGEVEQGLKSVLRGHRMQQDRPLNRRRLDDKLSTMPIHLRAEPGDYAPAVLLPGDPLRARRVAEEFLDDARQVNGERGMLGFTGTHEGTPVSVQATGMGCPSAAIVIEELMQLGADRLIRIGTCGGLQPDLELGDTIIALSAVPADGTARAYTRRRAACADRALRPHARRDPRRQGPRHPPPRGRDRLLRHVLRPRSGAPPAMGRARRAGGRDGGGRAVHDRAPCAASRRPAS